MAGASRQTRRVTKQARLVPDKCTKSIDMAAPSAFTEHSSGALTPHVAQLTIRCARCLACLSLALGGGARGGALRAGRWLSPGHPARRAVPLLRHEAPQDL